MTATTSATISSAMAGTSPATCTHTGSAYPKTISSSAPHRRRDRSLCERRVGHFFPAGEQLQRQHLVRDADENLHRLGGSLEHPGQADFRVQHDRRLCALVAAKPADQIAAGNGRSRPSQLIGPGVESANKQLWNASSPWCGTRSRSSPPASSTCMAGASSCRIWQERAIFKCRWPLEEPNRSSTPGVVVG